MTRVIQRVLRRLGDGGAKADGRRIRRDRSGSMAASLRWLHQLAPTCTNLHQLALKKISGMTAGNGVTLDSTAAPGYAGFRRTVTPPQHPCATLRLNSPNRCTVLQCVALCCSVLHTKIFRWSTATPGPIRTYPKLRDQLRPSRAGIRHRSLHPRYSVRK
jgi:hypothetical protein